MTCRWCNKPIRLSEKWALDFGGEVHREGCYDARWDAYFESGPTAIQFLPINRLYEMLLTVPERHTAAVQAAIDANRAGVL